jgi:hypothetical protein
VSGKTKIEVSDRDWDSSRGLKLILMEYLNCRVFGNFPLLSQNNAARQVTENPVSRELGVHFVPPKRTVVSASAPS